MRSSCSGHARDAGGARICERRSAGPSGRLAKDPVKQQIVINADSYETRIAILEEGELAELRVERSEQRRSVGDIYKGRVNAVMNGLCFNK